MKYTVGVRRQDSLNDMNIRANVHKIKTMHISYSDSIRSPETRSPLRVAAPLEPSRMDSALQVACPGPCA